MFHFFFCHSLWLCRMRKYSLKQSPSKLNRNVRAFSLWEGIVICTHFCRIEALLSPASSSDIRPKMSSKLRVLVFGPLFEPNPPTSNPCNFLAVGSWVMFRHSGESWWPILSIFDVFRPVGTNARAQSSIQWKKLPNFLVFFRRSN